MRFEKTVVTSSFNRQIRQIVWPSNLLSNGDETLDDDLQPRSINTEGGQSFSKATCRRKGCARTAQHLVNGLLQHHQM